MLSIVALTLIVAVAGRTTVAQQPPAGGFGNALQGLQQQQDYPAQIYYIGLQAYREGNLKTAGQAFEASLTASRKDMRSRYPEAICSYVMLAEIAYQLGDLRAAHQSLDQAAQTAVRWNGWFRRVKWSSTPANANRNTFYTPPWGTGPIPQPAAYPRQLPLESYNVGFGALPNGQTAAATTASQSSIDAVEIVRCLGVMWYRRWVILGPLGEGEPILNTVMDATKKPKDAPPYAGTLIMAMRGIGEFCDNKVDAGMQRAQAFARTSNGQVHPLSAPLMIAAARSMILRGQSDQAYNLLMEASRVAAVMDQAEWVAEAFRLAAGACPEQAKATLATVSKSAAGAYTRQSPMAAAMMALVSAEAAMDAG
ncbi:MAG: tetratricopeptide repeat protein, partial [Planctomycetota bacterium]